MLQERVGRLQAEDEMTEAQAGYMSSHRIFSAMESVVLNTKMDADAMHAKNILQLREELIGAMKYIVELRSAKTHLQAEYDLKMGNANKDLEVLRETLKAKDMELSAEKAAHASDNQEHEAVASNLQGVVDDLQAKLLAAQSEITQGNRALKAEKAGRAADADMAAKAMQAQKKLEGELERRNATAQAALEERLNKLESDLAQELPPYHTSRNSLPTGPLSSLRRRPPRLRSRRNSRRRGVDYSATSSRSRPTRRMCSRHSTTPRGMPQSAQRRQPSARPRSLPKSRRSRSRWPRQWKRRPGQRPNSTKSR